MYRLLRQLTRIAEMCYATLTRLAVEIYVAASNHYCLCAKRAATTALMSDLILVLTLRSGRQSCLMRD